MINRLYLTSNAQYFKTKKKLSKRLINDCLKKAAENSIGRNTEAIRHELTVGSNTFKISYCIFKIERKPPFLISGDERDLIHNFVVLIEVDDFLVINKSGGQDFFKLIEKYLKAIDTSILQNAFVKEDSHFEKIAAQSIDTRKNLLKKVTYEDPDLQISLPVFGASQKVVKNVRHKTDGKRYTTNPNKSKLNILGQKGFLADFCQTAYEAFDRFKNYKPKENFLSNFATLLNLPDYSNKIFPREILLLTSDIIQLIEENENQTPKFFYQKVNHRKIYFTKPFIDILDEHAELKEISEKKENGVKIFYIRNEFDKSLQIIQSETKFKLKSKKFKNLYFEFDEHTIINIQQYINETQNFILTFDKSDIRYSGGQLCQDSKLLGNIENFLQIFIPDKNIESITSEKGKFNSKSTSFEKNSLFHYTEQNYSAGIDDLILDDLGYESSDYIGTKKGNKIQLFHCKFSKNFFSASAFQEVIGQALKNLSFFYQTSGIDKKASMWGDKYGKTKIDRVRKGDKNEYLNNLKATVVAANYDREVYLIINFISLKTLTDELNKLKNNKAPKRQTNQILWLISSLKNSCHERGIKIFITCKD